MKNRLSATHYINGIIAGNLQILSKAITLSESKLTSDRTLVQEIIQAIPFPENHATKIGISGIPGAGKSTIIEGLGTYLIKLNHRVAVLTVDPSSSLSQGSILGDKTRMQGLAANSNAYIRTSPSKSHLGGAAVNTAIAIELCEKAGFDTIIVETVGAGQSEIEVTTMTDCFILVVIAGAGDELQAQKKGIIEVSDIILVNKADGNNLLAAELTKRQLRNGLNFSSLNKTKSERILEFSALNVLHFAGLWKLINEVIQADRQSSIFSKNREKQELIAIHKSIERRIIENIYNQEAVKNVLAIIEGEVLHKQKSVAEAASELIKIFKTNN